MKKQGVVLVLVLLVAVVVLLFVSRRPAEPPAGLWPGYEDGAYRGVFIDGDAIQVNVQFTLKDGIVTDASFRHLRRDDNYHHDTDREPYRSVVNQYLEALDYLVGKNLSDHLADLYRPEDIVSTRVDGYTAATIRSSKIISAIRDALNRGVYSY